MDNRCVIATAHRCQPLFDDDGNLVATFHGGELDEQGRTALLDIVGAAKRHHAATGTPERAARQAAGIARIRERAARLREA